MSTKNVNSRRPQKGRKRSKEMEVNGAEKMVSRADLPHVRTSATTGGGNDPSWYKKIPNLADAYGSIPFNQITGIYEPKMPKEEYKYVVPGTANVTVQDDTLRSTTPGIMTISLAPTYPSLSSNSAINIAAQQIYTLDRAANSGAKNYDKTDLMMLVIAMDSPYMLYEELNRVYKLFTAYNYMNRYQPDAVIQALGFSPKLKEELADFRGLMDTFAYQLSSINIPDKFSFIHRHSWMFTNIYKDSEEDTAQLYAYKPHGYYKWTEGVGEEPTYLKFVTRTSIYGTSGLVDSVAQIRTAINTLMEPLLGSQDVGIISGDLAKAFGESSMIKISPITPHETLLPVYNMEVINQMMNTEIATGFATDGIKSNNTDLVKGPFLESEYRCTNYLKVSRNHLLNLHEMTGSVDDVLTSTRLMFNASPTISGSGPYYTVITSCGTEVATSVDIFYFTTNSAHGTTELVADSIQQEMIVDENTTAIQDFMAPLSMISVFDNHPSVFMYNRTGKAPDFALMFNGCVQDIDKHVWLSDSDIANLNECCILSEFYVDGFK